jgi:hypothetical protein
MPNFIKRKHPKKRREKETRGGARIKVQASKQPKRGKNNQFVKDSGLFKKCPPLGKFIFPVLYPLRLQWRFT